MKSRYFLGRMDVITALAGAAPPSRRLEIEIEVVSDKVDPRASQVRRVILNSLESKMLRLLTDQEGTGTLTIVPASAISKIWRTPIEPAAVPGIKIWGIVSQLLATKEKSVAAAR